MSNQITISDEARAAAKWIRYNRPSNPAYWYQHENDSERIQLAINAATEKLKSEVEDLRAEAESLRSELRSHNLY